MNEKEYKKSLRQFHKHSDRHILVVETDMSFSDIQKVVALSDKIRKAGNVVWSGDVPSTFEAFYDQLQAGLNMGLAGIPWWTTDIGGIKYTSFPKNEMKSLKILSLNVLRESYRNRLRFPHRALHTADWSPRRPAPHLA
jgi:hypothetical protein